MSAGSSSTVLAVIADAAKREALADALRETGFRVHEAATGAQALQFAEHLPLLIILGETADMSSDEVYDRLKGIAGGIVPVLRLGGCAGAGAARPPVDAAAAEQHVDAGASPHDVAARARLLVAAAASERLLHGCFEAASDAVLVADAHGCIVRANGAAELLFGYERTELLGRTVDKLIPERLRAAHRAHYEAYLEAPRPRRMGAGSPLLGLHRDGREFPVDIALSPLVDGSRRLVMAAVRDVSELRSLEAALQERTRELEEADRQKDLFVATLAHELRSPLAALTNVASLLRCAPADDEARSLATGVLERQTAHMSRLVEDLVDVARVRSGGVALRRQPTDLLEVIARACELAGPLIGARRHSFTLNLPPRPVRVDGDATRLAQVLANLLTNAARYTPEGGSIVLALEVEQDDAILHVRDNGAGMTPRMLTKSFELFAQAQLPDGRTAGGLGIGLTLVRRLVEMHGGTVVAHSDGEGRGSEFLIRLPLLRGAMAADAT